MEPIPDEIRELAREARFPAPTGETFVLTDAQARQFRSLLDALIEYLQIQYARCGKETSPTPAG